jgi:hypothetical protein
MHQWVFFAIGMSLVGSPLLVWAVLFWGQKEISALFVALSAIIAVNVAIVAAAAYFLFRWQP